MLQAAAERAFCCCSLARLLCLVHRLLPLALPLARTLCPRRLADQPAAGSAALCASTRGRST